MLHASENLLELHSSCDGSTNFQFSAHEEFLRSNILLDHLGEELVGRGQLHVGLDAFLTFLYLEMR